MSTLASRGPQPVQRKIQFFRVARGVGAQRRPLDWAATTARLRSLAPDETGRYVNDGQDNFFFMVPYGSLETEFLFAITRRNNLPSLELEGVVSPLTLPANHGLAEIVHVKAVDPTTIAVVYNHYGPRILPRFRNYLDARLPAPLVEGLSVRQLCSPDALTRLQNLREITGFEIKVTPGGADLVAMADDSLGAAFKAGMQVGHPKDMRLTLQAERARPLDGMKERIGRIVNVLRNARGQETVESVQTLTAKGFDPDLGRIASVDLLEDFLITTKRIMRESTSSRSLDHDSAFAELHAAYGEMQERLANAAEVS